MRSAGRDVFLTGGTGFIGGRLAAALAARGDRLRCLVRDTSKAGPLEALGARIVQGDISDDIALEHGLRGVDLAFHLAAVYDLGAVDSGTLERVNVDGTRAFLLVAGAAGVPRLVYVSTTGALGPSQGGEPASFEAWPGPYPSEYHRTKAHAHALARRAQERGLALIIVCPANVYGPGDEGPNGHFVRDLLRRRVPGLLSRPGAYSYVHVDDVVAGLIAAADHGRVGSTYVLSGEDLSVNDFAEKVTGLAGVRPPRLRFPPALARGTGGVLDLVSRWTGKRFSISRESVAVSVHPWLHGHALATKELGWQPRPLAEGLPGTIDWYIGRRGRPVA